MMKAFLARRGFAGDPAPGKKAGAPLNSRSLASMSVTAVYTELITDCSAKTLQAIIRGKVSPESIVHSDCWKGYDGLVDVGYDKHFCINKSRYFAEKTVHINGIKAFWSFTKRRPGKFNGVKPNFELHLKECEWRYNRTLPQLLAALKLMVSKNKRGCPRAIYIFRSSLSGW